MGPPQFSMWMFVSSFLPFVVSWFWRTFGAAGCVPSVMSQPQKQDCHTRQRVDLARPFLVSPAIKIELKTASKWPCPKRKAVARGNPIFGSVEPCDLLETRSSYITQVNQSWVLFKQQASTQLGRTTFWSPKSQCVYGPENEIAAVTFFCEKWRSFTKKQYFCKCNGMAGFRGTRLLIEGL